MSKIFTLLVIAATSLPLTSIAQASIALPQIERGAALTVVAGWGCVYIPGAGQFCGEDGNDKIPEEK